MHPRRQIRNFVAEYLAGTTEGGEPRTDAGAAVYAGRDLPFGRDDFERGIVVYTPDEDVDRDHMHQGGNRRHVMRMEIQAYAVGDDGEDKADDMAWQVEEALRAIPTLENRVESCDVIRTESAFADNGEQALWVTALIYEVAYWTHEQPNEEGRPTIVLIGFWPDIGPGHEPDYTQIHPAPDVGEWTP